MTLWQPLPPPAKKSSLGAVCITFLTAQEHDLNTGLIYFGARYYDPDTARFISQDTYAGEQNRPPSLHRYLYAASNPLVFIDLYGFDYVSSDDESGKVFWTVEEDGWLYNKDVRQIEIGQMKDGRVELTAEFRNGSDTSGSSVPFDALQNSASNFWNRRNSLFSDDISGLPAGVQDNLIGSYIQDTFFTEHLSVNDKQARTYDEKYQISQTAKDLGKTAAIAGANGLAWGTTGPLLGVPVSALTIAYGAKESYESREEQFEARGWDQPTAMEMTAIVAGDATGINAIRGMVTGVEPVTQDRIPTADRIKTGAHIAVGAAAGYTGFKSGLNIKVGNEPFYFSQESVGRTFSPPKESPFKYAGEPVADVANGLRTGTIHPDEIPVRYIIENGKKIVVDNRSLLALKRAGIEPTVSFNVTNDAALRSQTLTRVAEQLNGIPQTTIRVSGAGRKASIIH